MNYRTMVKGALALSLSLIVGSSWAGDSQQYGVTFEQTPVGTVENDFAYTNNMPITDSTLRGVEDSQPYGWFAGSEEDESKVVERTDAAGGHALQLNTDANTLTNQLAKSVAEKLNNVLAGENGETQGVVYFETDVKFVASDTDDAGIKGNTDATKFAIYAYAKEDAEPATTNLVVYHAYQYVDENDDIITDFTNEVFKSVSIDTEVYTKLRIEMKKLEVDEGAYQNVFSVSINGGDPISSATALDKVLDPTAPGIWFQTVEDAIGGANNAKVAALNFKGTGAIDNIKAGVIEEAQPPDDTWTLTGFAPDPGNILPDAATSTDTMLVYSNFTGNYVAKDASIGRTIDAFWIGAKIIAPEAVTSETIGSWKFDMAGNPGLSFNACKDGQDGETGLYYMYAWVPVTAAKVRAAIAEPKNDIVYTFDFYNENDLTVTQRLSMVVSPADVVLTNTDEVPGVETIEVINWEEQGVATATIISVAKLSATGAMVNEAAPMLTATVTDENGDAVAAADYTIDASAIDMTTAGLYPVIITATGEGYTGTLTNYYAVMSLTWFNGTPTQKALIEPQNIWFNAMHYMHTSQDRAYLAVNGDNTNGQGKGILLYSVATLTSIYGTCTSVWEVAHNTTGGGKGLAANTASGIMLAGGGTTGGTVGAQSTFKGYDIADLANIGTDTNMVEVSYTAEWEGSGYASGQVMDGIDFNHAGTKIFGNNAGTDGPWVYQLAIDKNAKTMTWEATYTTPFARVRSVSAYYIDGKDYVFVGEGASSGKGEIAVIDPSNGSITTICVAADDFTTAEFPAGRYFTSVKVSGIASGEMYLYGSTDKGEVVVWALGHDAVNGEWKTAPVGNITSAQAAALLSYGSIGNSRAFDVSDDNTAGFLYAQGITPNHIAVVTDISLARRKALASATLTPAGSDKDVALGAITATVLDENGDTVAASEYTITTNLIDIATAGEYTVTITPVEGSIYSNAVTAVYTISEAAVGYNYPEGGAIEDAAVVAWLTAKGFTQAQVTALGTNAKLNECYLLNCDISQAGAGGSIAITAITVTGSSVTVTVELDRTAGIAGGINGTLKLYGKADLAAAGDFADTEATVGDAKFASDTSTTATLSGGTAKFFRAVVE